MGWRLKIEQTPDVLGARPFGGGPRQLLLCHDASPCVSTVRFRCPALGEGVMWLRWVGFATSVSWLAAGSIGSTIVGVPSAQPNGRDDSFSLVPLSLGMNRDDIVSGYRTTESDRSDRAVRLAPEVSGSGSGVTKAIP